MDIHNLPMFRELSLVICSHKIESWQAEDFWDQVKLLKVVENNINYQSVYQLILWLVKDGYLLVDTKKKGGKIAYTETEKIKKFRSEFGVESPITVNILELKKDELERDLLELIEEINILNDLKKILPKLQFKMALLHKPICKGFFSDIIFK
ncbi:hypothetical protein [Acinetobacter lwoffii]|uniref:hypothetical protein n=1 Tax=Acinetobacter lwoffii TaxID=28090 RepID=UPI00209B14A8|nr:hypothetical protein [Acinetobacter lwoffii]MCO8063304.1 hypothetical protein [Acinetobacter lwoffii]